MHHIIVGHDGSEGAEQALKLVAALNFPPDTSSSVVAAIPDVRAIRSAWGRLILGPPGTIEQQLTAQATQSLAEVAERAERMGLRAATKVVVGRPAAALAAEAQRSGATLLAVGSRGLGRMRSLVMGSVSAELVQIAACPVLVARSASLKRIVLATDGSTEADLAAEYLTNVPAARHLPVSIVSVVETLDASVVGAARPDGDPLAGALSRYTSLARQHHEKVASAAAGRLATHGITAQIEVRIGNPGAEVLRSAGRHDLVVLGWGGQSKSSPALGAVLHKVLYGSSASVLIVR